MKKVKIKKDYVEIATRLTKERKAIGRNYCGDEENWESYNMDTTKVYDVLSIDGDGDIILKDCNDGKEFYLQQLEVIDA